MIDWGGGVKCPSISSSLSVEEEQVLLTVPGLGRRLDHID